MKVVVIGSGNVAEAFAFAIENSSLELVQVYGRNREHVESIYSAICSSLSYSETLATADLYIISVSDGAIESLSRTLDFAQGSIVVHTAASVDIGSINTRKGINRGVIYPLQTFTKGRRVNFREVPIFVEAESEGCYETLEQVASELSGCVSRLSSAKRKELHLGAVFACNFTMAMMTATQDIMVRSGLSLSVYEPLMRETLAKAFETRADLRSALTGPAVRGDVETMNRHLELIEGEEMLSESAQLIDIYKIISKYIWETSKRI